MDKPQLNRLFVVVAIIAVVAVAVAACSSQPARAPGTTRPSASTDANKAINNANSPQGATAGDGTWADENVAVKPADPWSVMPEVNMKANSRFNLYNGGYATAAGDWILYNNPDDNGYLYRMNIHNQESVRLCTVLNVSNIVLNTDNYDLAYFAGCSDFGTNHKIYAYVTVKPGGT